MKENKKVIFGTNIWISYFISHRFDQIAELIIQNELEVLTSDSLVNKLTNVLSRNKFTKQLKYPIERYINFHKTLTLHFNPEKSFSESPDIKDNFLFDLALQTNCCQTVEICFKSSILLAIPLS